MSHFVPIIFIYSALFALGGAVVMGFMFRKLKEDGAGLFSVKWLGYGETFLYCKAMLVIALLFACPSWGNLKDLDMTAFEYLADFMELFTLWLIWAYTFATIVEKRFVSLREFIFKKKEKDPDAKLAPKKPDDKNDKGKFQA